MLGDATDVGYTLVVTRAPDMRPQDLRVAWDVMRARGAEAVLLVAADTETGKPIFLAAGSDAAVAAGFDAGALVREIAPVLGGRGGGKPSMAQGGGDAADKIGEALEADRRQLCTA